MAKAGGRNAPSAAPQPARRRRDASLLRGHDDRALLLDAERSHRLGFRLLKRRLLDRAPLAVEPVDRRRSRRPRSDLPLQQPHAEIGAADAAAGIDARAQQEAEMPRSGGPSSRATSISAVRPGMLAPAQRDQTLGHEGAIQAFERHHVGDRAERDKIRAATADPARAARVQKSRRRNSR